MAKQADGKRTFKKWDLLDDGQLYKEGPWLKSVPANQTVAGEQDSGKTFGGATVYRQAFSGTRAADSSTDVQEVLAASGIAGVVSVTGHLTLASGNKIVVLGQKNDGTNFVNSAVEVTAAGAMNLEFHGELVAANELTGWDIVVEYTKA